MKATAAGRRFRLALPLSLAALTPLRAAEPKGIDLWPEGVPGFKADVPPERVENERIYSVSRPTLTCFPAPAGPGTGTGVVVCPGGGYVRLAMVNEGAGAAHWLNSVGVSAFVLKYRMQEYGHPAPLQDVLRAVRYLRAHAAEYGLRPDRIGVYGGSAGGHLAACAGTLYDAPEGRTGAELDAVSARPDFLILQYPVITMKPPFVHVGSRVALLGRTPSAELIEHLSVELHVTKNTPPTFLIHSEEDRAVPTDNSILFYQALRAAGVPVEMHLYEKGPHGFGFRTDLGVTSDWPKRGEEWLRAHGWLTPAAAEAAPAR